MNPTFRRFADCLLLGVFTAFASILVVTAYPALVTACSMLRDDEPVGPIRFARRLLTTLRAAWLPALAFPLLLLDVAALRAGVPGAWALAVVLGVVVVIGLRGAAVWHPSLSWAGVARDAWRDPSGSVLMALAGAGAAAIVALVPVTALLVGGPLANALVAVEGRRRG
ncbi:hypothetical protein [Allorhizocola rhizosphaerae]|uniref:hypothetical protein n=1 Tax=Allorhizocola rhizosphaerae TaxID=1872709 RepID=UPI000E3DDA44|nr:hypothetical protein [Allorhizocola rhizosphaerae]